MRTFTCPSCDGTVFFDSDHCEACQSPLSYAPDDDGFVVGGAPGDDVPRCANAGTVEVCNWLPDIGSPWCRSCAMDTDHEPTELRRPFQRARRRTVRQLLALGVDLTAAPPPRFALIEGTESEPVTTGHQDGLITLDTTEGDPARLVEVREDMGEPYRTPLGHVRHELGHWYWQAQVDGTFSTTDFRATFGDERLDYAEALASHYGVPDDGSWTQTHISHYAASHPWEDFAESFAHLLHLVDTLETAQSHGWGGGAGAPAIEGFDDLWARWVECTTVLNDLNRAMGTPDPYPFVAAPAAVDKVRFVADAVGLRPGHLAAA